MITINEPKLSEIDAFKRHTAVIAKKYARKHNLCSVVDDALKEIGIDPSEAKPKTQYIEATATVTFKASIDPTDFSGLDESEQLDKLTELVKDGKIKLNFNTSDVVFTKAVDSTFTALTLPDGYSYGYIGPGGRVKHIIHRGRYSAYSLCEAYVDVTDIPERITEVCKTCEKKLAQEIG